MTIENEIKSKAKDLSLRKTDWDFEQIAHVVMSWFPEENQMLILINIEEALAELNQ